MPCIPCPAPAQRHRPSVSELESVPCLLTPFPASLLCSTTVQVTTPPSHLHDYAKPHKVHGLVLPCTVHHEIACSSTHQCMAPAAHNRACNMAWCKRLAASQLLAQYGCPIHQAAKVNRLTRDCIVQTCRRLGLPRDLLWDASACKAQGSCDRQTGSSRYFMACHDVSDNASGVAGGLPPLTLVSKGGDESSRSSKHHRNAHDLGL